MSGEEALRKAARQMRVDNTLAVNFDGGTVAEQTLLAVADLLDDQADGLNDALAEFRPRDEAEWTERNFRLPLAVARVYLGESA